MDMHICLRQVLLVRSAKKIIGYCLKFAEIINIAINIDILLQDYIPNIKYCFNKNVFLMCVLGMPV